MAIVRDNILMEGLSGMFGRSIVFKNLRGKTIVALRPAAPSKQSEKQKANRSKFKDASHWAREVLQDAGNKEYYQKRAKKLNLPNAYTAAITDYMRKPRVMKSFTENEGTNYCVNKKGFALKKVEVVVARDGVSEILPAQRLSCGDWNFLLRHDDQQANVYIRIEDATDCVFTMGIPRPR